MELCILFAALGIPALFLFVREKLRAYGPKAVLLKALVSALFMSTAIAAQHAAGRGSFGCFAIAGQLFGLLGDIWLDLKYAYPHDDRIYTMAGFKSFAIGHLLFMLGMALNFADLTRPAYIVLPLVLGIACGVATVLSGPRLKLDYGEYKRISIVYGGILFSAVFLSGSLAMQNGWRCVTLDMMFAGEIAFAASDLVLSGTYFAEGRERPVDIILNCVLYYAAQFTIALSILFQ